MSKLNELYKQVILDHSAKPCNFRKIQNSNYCAQGYNKLCGDRMSIEMDIQKNIIEDIAFTGCGCAITKASASVMTTLVKGKTVIEAKDIFTQFKKMVTEGKKIDNFELKKLKIFAGVKKFPGRVKCAMLPWHTMYKALQDY